MGAALNTPSSLAIFYEMKEGVDRLNSVCAFLVFNNDIPYIWS